MYQENITGVIFFLTVDVVVIAEVMVVVVLVIYVCKIRSCEEVVQVR